MAVAYSFVPAWLRAGLAEIELVHKHEMSVLHLHEKRSPCCPYSRVFMCRWHMPDIL